MVTEVFFLNYIGPAKFNPFADELKTDVSIRDFPSHYILPDLKVPKREIFLTELIILSYSIWIGDLGTKGTNSFV